MAVLSATHMRCKNKLCDYEGIVRYVNRISDSDLVCPKCGSKTLTQYWPGLEKIFGKEKP